MQYGVKVTFARDVTNISWYESKEERDDLFDLIRDKGFEVIGVANHETLLVNNSMALFAEKVEK